MRQEGLVFVVDDDPEVVDSWKCVLEVAELETQTYTTAEDFLENADFHRTCCLILDLRMPGMGGQRLLEVMRQRKLAIPVIVISGHADVPAAIGAMKMGLVDFLIKPVDPAIVVDKIQNMLRTAAEGKAQKSNEEIIRRCLATLTSREMEVFRLLVSGKLHKQVAFDLGLSPRTVEHHHARINLKMQANNLADLMRMAFLGGIF